MMARIIQVGSQLRNKNAQYFLQFPWDLRERGELAKTFYKYMRLPVRGDTEKAREITVLKYYLYSKGVLAVSRDGALYINMDKTSGE